MHTDLEKILFDEDAIRRRVGELAEQNSADYQGCDLLLIGILKGGGIFLSDLSRAMSLPHELARSAPSG